MQDVTEAGRKLFADTAQRYGLPPSAVEAMARAVANGGGTMAQFNIPELGGSGQWMAGGMTMVGDMFNNALQATVANLCTELSQAMQRATIFKAPPGMGGAGSSWWPVDLGAPSATGGQNSMRYAYFPQARRLAVDFGDASEPALLDTLDHQIGGFSQQQSGYGDPFVGLTFSSQYGQFAASSLPRVGAPQPQPQPQSQPTPETLSPDPAAFADAPSRPSEPAQPSAGADILDTIERLAKLRDAGALTEDEFAVKKAELLSRL